jgi:ABC-2 type transport system permease protein
MCVSALVIGWGTLWFAAGVLVNSFGLSSANNALILVGSWIAFVVILPGILHVSVSTFLPSVSSIHVMHEVREAGQKAKAELDALTGSHDDRRLAKGYAKRVVEIEQRIAAQAEPVLLEAHKQEQAQYDALRWLIYLSPASLIQARLEDLAGVSSRRYERFESQAEAFHGVFTEYFYGFIKKGTPFESEGLDALPRFTFHDEPVADLVRRTLGGSLFLFLLSVLLVGGAWGRLRSIGRLTR